MRKLVFLTVAVLALGVAGAALAGQAATNSVGSFVDLNVAVTPPVAGTAKVPQGVGVTFDSFTGNRINGNRPDRNSSITVRFNRGFKLNSSKFPACTLSLNPAAFSSCSKASKIGAGTAEGTVPGANGNPPTFIPAKLTAFNGKPFKGKPTVIFQATIAGKLADELDFSVSNKPLGPYGLSFTSIVFPGTTAAVQISKFSVKIPDRSVTHKVKGKKVKIHLLDAPTTCHGSWVFEQTNTFTNEQTLNAKDSQPCVG